MVPNQASGPYLRARAVRGRARRSATDSSIDEQKERPRVARIQLKLQIAGGAVRVKGRSLYEEGTVTTVRAALREASEQRFTFLGRGSFRHQQAVLHA